MSTDILNGIKELWHVPSGRLLYDGGLKGAIKLYNNLDYIGSYRPNTIFNNDDKLIYNIHERISVPYSSDINNEKVVAYLTSGSKLYEVLIAKTTYNNYMIVDFKKSSIYVAYDNGSIDKYNSDNGNVIARRSGVVDSSRIYYRVMSDKRNHCFFDTSGWGSLIVTNDDLTTTRYSLPEDRNLTYDSIKCGYLNGDIFYCLYSRTNDVTIKAYNIKTRNSTTYTLPKANNRSTDELGVYATTSNDVYAVYNKKIIKLKYDTSGNRLSKIFEKNISNISEYNTSTKEYSFILETKDNVIICASSVYIINKKSNNVYGASIGDKSECENRDSFNVLFGNNAMVVNADFSF